MDTGNVAAYHSGHTITEEIYGDQADNYVNNNYNFVERLWN